jgi:hypothetical protein
MALAAAKGFNKTRVSVNYSFTFMVSPLFKDNFTSRIVLNYSEILSKLHWLISPGR